MLCTHTIPGTVPGTPEIQRCSNVYRYYMYVLYESGVPKNRVTCIFRRTVSRVDIVLFCCQCCAFYELDRILVSLHPFYLYAPVYIQHENDSPDTDHSVTGIGLFADEAENVFSQNVYT